MLTVACVLRSGGEYTPHHVDQLREGVARNLTLPYKFVCLTDMKVDCDYLPLKHGWPGWWSKCELWRPGLFEGDAVYFDLDTIIVGTLNGIVLGHSFTVLRNFWAESYGEPDRIGSGLMAWNTDLTRIYETFRRNAGRFIRMYRTRARWGDQAFIKEHSPIPMERWQDKFPGRVVSFKKHVLPKQRVPEGAAVCCFHGEPRPWKLKPAQLEWFKKKVVVKFSQTKVRLSGEPQWIE